MLNVSSESLAIRGIITRAKEGIKATFEPKYSFSKDLVKSDGLVEVKKKEKPIAPIKNLDSTRKQSNHPPKRKVKPPRIIITGRSDHRMLSDPLIFLNIIFSRMTNDRRRARDQFILGIRKPNCSRIIVNPSKGWI